MTTTVTQPTFVPNLKIDPRLVWKKFDNAIKTEARQTCRAITGGTGLLGFFLPAAQWNAFPPNRILQADGTIVVTAVFDVATAIPVVANNAPAAAVKIWQNLIDDRAAVLEATQLFTAKLINSIPDADISELSDDTWGMLSVTCAQIYTHLQTKYNVLNQEDFDTITTRLSLPKGASEDFPSLAERHRDLHATCASAGQPISEYNKCMHYTEAMKSNHAGMSAIKLYTDTVPLIANRTFAALVMAVSLHAPNYVATPVSLGYSSAMAAASTHFSPIPSTPQNEAGTIAAQISQLQRNLAALRRTTPGSSTGGGRKTTKLYCYVHGHCFHNGAKCKTILSSPESYTAAQVAATDPTHPPGGSTRS